MPPRLLLLTPIELTHDPRARRAALAARARGLEVASLSGGLTAADPSPLGGVEVVRVGRPTRTNHWHAGRLSTLGNETAAMRELRGLFRLGRLGTRTVRLYRGGRRLGRAEIIHANDLDTLPAAWLLARRWNARLVYDVHELYSEFEEDPPRLYRAAALTLERVLARRSNAVVTVSPALAAALVGRLGLPRTPFVVLNTPELVDVEPLSTPSQGPLRVVYQGSLGTGRSLADLLEAATLAPSTHLTVRVVRVAVDALRREVAARGLGDRVTIAAPVPATEVVSALRDYEVGIVFDRPVTKNGELTLPNKLFEYLMAGLAVVAPRLSGLASIVEGERVGITFEPGRPDLLAAALEELAADRALLLQLREQARTVAVSRYSSEAQRDKLAAVWGIS